MTTKSIEEHEWDLIQNSIVRLRSRIMAIAFGAAGGVSLLVATLWLVVRGGPNVGQHLSMLRHYFPGYTVTYLGSLVGLGYGVIVGGILGWSIARIYNYLAGGNGTNKN